MIISYLRKLNHTLPFYYLCISPQLGFGLPLNRLNHYQLLHLHNRHFFILPPARINTTFDNRLPILLLSYLLKPHSDFPSHSITCHAIRTLELPNKFIVLSQLPTELITRLPPLFLSTATTLPQSNHNHTLEFYLY